MSLRSRPMEPRDVAECAKIIGEHPAIGPRYGKSIADLRQAWLRLIGCEAMKAILIEEVKGARVTVCFVGVSTFVRDDFVGEIKKLPLWVGPELARRVLRGDSPLLSDKQMREANSADGLNLVIWEGCIRSGFERHSELYRWILEGFIEEHRGYFLNEAIASQMESIERLRWTLDTGGCVWSAAEGRYVESVDRPPEEIIREPHLVGVTREMERGRPGTWVGALFDYRVPKIGFSGAEQRLLRSARAGGTDEDLSKLLGSSLSTVKNTWRSIYSRAAAHLPELFSNGLHADGRVLERGKEKRRHLVTYLRDHPEELRPVSKKLVRQTAKRRRPTEH